MTRIVLVEDNKIIKIVHERVLSRAGYKVTVAEDGEQALEAVRSNPPEAILLDMMLPKLSGPEVLRKLKADPATAGIPVIVLTALSKKNEDKLRAEGAAAFVEKESLSRDAGPLLRVLDAVIKDSIVKKSSTLVGGASACLPVAVLDAGEEISLEEAGFPAACPAPPTPAQPAFA